MRLLRERPFMAAALAGLAIMFLAGGVVLTTTTAGCGSAQRLGLQGILSKCAGPTPVADVAPTPSPSAVASVTPSVFGSPTPSTSPVAATPDSGPAAFPPFRAPTTHYSGPTLELSCRIPVSAGPLGSGGFITFPGGKFTADPTSAAKAMSPVHAPSPPPSVFNGSYGSAGLSYSLAYTRWLPVSLSSVTPDGSRFVYGSPHFAIYVVDVASGDASEVGAGRNWNIVGVQNEGIYATILSNSLGVHDPPGLWLIPYSGEVTQITKTGYWQAAASGAAYGQANLSGVAGDPNNTIIRLDLRSGAVTDWFIRLDGWSNVFAIDGAGNALITVGYSNGEGELWITTAPKIAVPILNTDQGLFLTGHPFTDSHGIWLPIAYHLSPGVALYVVGDGLYWMSGASIAPTRIQAESGTQLAGGCI